ncbi:MAG TPA: ABC transporter permease subunit [Rhizomicrobium sp.]|nr:ABC transporter permease subunit [Rhizomicrobium sp.]
MWRIWLIRAARLLASLIGVLVLVVLLAMAPKPPHGFVPFLSAFLAKFGAAFRGDFGNSSVTGAPALDGVMAVLPDTLQLLGGGALVAIAVGVPLGLVLSASRTLRAAAPLIQIVAATPVFVAALALIWLSVRVLHWSEASQASALSWTALVKSQGWDAALRVFALPALTVGAAGAASIQFALRRAAATALLAPYREGLRMMGLGALDIDIRYTLPEILAVLLRGLDDVALALISAAAVAEWVFHRSGAAVLFLRSVALGDWNIVAVVLALFAVMTILVGFLGAAIAQIIVPEDT